MRNKQDNKLCIKWCCMSRVGFLSMKQKQLCWEDGLVLYSVECHVVSPKEMCYTNHRQAKAVYTEL